VLRGGAGACLRNVFKRVLERVVVGRLGAVGGNDSFNGHGHKPMLGLVFRVRTTRRMTTFRNTYDRTTEYPGQGARPLLPRLHVLDVGVLRRPARAHSGERLCGGPSSRASPGVGGWRGASPAGAPDALARAAFSSRNSGQVGAWRAGGHRPVLEQERHHFLVACLGAGCVRRQEGAPRPPPLVLIGHASSHPPY